MNIASISMFNDFESSYLIMIIVWSSDSFGNVSVRFLSIISQEFQSFTDLEFSKERTITCIDWHPTIKGVVAVSVGERLPFDDRIDNAHRIIMTPSLILIWSFSDPIHPQVVINSLLQIKDIF